jgi:hypothetical protein
MIKALAPAIREGSCGVTGLSISTVCAAAWQARLNWRVLSG